MSSERRATPAEIGNTPCRQKYALLYAYNHLDQKGSCQPLYMEYFFLFFSPILIPGKWAMLHEKLLPKNPLLKIRKI
jgi:hypothetical protein